jgi:hypothetical protein
VEVHLFFLLIRFVLQTSNKHLQVHNVFDNRKWSDVNSAFTFISINTMSRTLLQKNVPKLFAMKKKFGTFAVCPEGELLKQDRQCTHNVILSRVRAAIVAGEKHAMCMRHIAICGLFGSTIFFHIVSQTFRFSKKRNAWFDFVYKFCL